MNPQNKWTYTFYPERTIKYLDERKREVTIEHLLAMTPGYQWNIGVGSRTQESRALAQFVID